LTFAISRVPFLFRMLSPADIAAQHDAGLALLFERGLELALRVQEDAMAAEMAEERAKLAHAFHRISRGVRQTAALRAKLAHAFHRISRGVRQTAALRAKLAHDAVRAERDETAEVVRLNERRVAKRRAQVRATVERLIWTEAETPERAEHLVSDLETFLDEDEVHGRLDDGEVEAHIVRLAAELGLKPPPSEAREIGEGASAPDAYRPAAPEWRSSA
jgi:hypothetical protein